MDISERDIKEQKKLRLWQCMGIIAGLLIAILIVIQLNDFIVRDACLDHGGRFIEQQRLCIDPRTEYKHSLEPTLFMFIGYALVLLMTPLLFKRLADSLIARHSKEKNSKDKK